MKTIIRKLKALYSKYFTKWNVDEILKREG